MGGSKAEVLRMDFLVILVLQRATFTNAGGPHGANLVHATTIGSGAVDGPYRFALQSLENLGEGWCLVPLGHSDELALRARGVEKRSDEIEDRLHAFLAQLGPDSGDRLEGGMVIASIEEAYPRTPDCGLEVDGTLLDVDPESFQDIGPSALGGDAPIAMLDHDGSSSRD